MKSPRAFRSAVAGALLLGLPFSTGCSSTPGLKQAEQADYVGLRKTLGERNLNANQTRRIAQAVLSTDIRNAKDRADREFIRSLRACSGKLSKALSKRADTRDGVGAEAALLLLESGNWNKNPSSFRDEEDGAWRALAARAAKSNGEQRRDFFVDDDERVRRAALSAALDTADEKDLPALLEVSRLDPDHLTRNRAYQTMGRIGGPRVVDALRDRYSAADEELRLAIVDAWGQPRVFNAGGERELTRIMTHETGFPALHAASILVRKPSADLANQADTRLQRFIHDGTPQERRLALRVLPIERPSTTSLLVANTKNEDQEVALIAWARLLGDPEHAKAAQKELSEWARSDSPLAYQARAALAASADDRILPLLIRQSEDADPETRQVAGYGLVRLGSWPYIARLLADPDPGVRHAVACRTVAREPQGSSGAK